MEGTNNANLKVELLLQGIMVSALPTLILFDNGKPICTHSGVITDDELDAWLNEHHFSKPSSKKEEKEEVLESKKGFVSFTSQFGRDDYAL